MLVSVCMCLCMHIKKNHCVSSVYKKVGKWPKSFAPTTRSVCQVGYSNGYTTNPFYREVCSEKTGHTEVVRVVFDPDVIPYVDLLKMFWENHDPTQGMRQRADKGTRYRSGIYCYGSQQKDLATQSRDLYAEVLRKNEFKREITTEIESAGEFYYAEDYHQQYLYKDEGSHCPLMGGTGYACPMGLLKPGTPEHK